MLKDIVKYLRSVNKMPVGEKKDESILSLRKVLKVSNLTNLKSMVPEGAFRMSNSVKADPYVLGAWIRMCQIAGEKRSVDTAFDIERLDELVGKIKGVMLDEEANIQEQLRNIFAEHGIDFSVVKNFRRAPVQGYVSPKSDGSYQMVLTIRNAFADIFWFSLFHELGHIANGDISKNAKFVDVGTDEEKENAADEFAKNKLISEIDYREFVDKRDYSIDSILSFARTQNVMPYIVIGRLQKEKVLDYKTYSQYKTRYKWAE